MKLRPKMSSRRSPTSRRVLADLSALADGSLQPERREQVQEEIARSPELVRLLEAEQRAVEQLREARDSDRAPLALRERIEAQRQRAPATHDGHRRRQRQRRAWAPAAVGAAAAIAVLIATLPAGAPGSPTLAQAARLATRGASRPAPAVNASQGRALDQSVGEVYFPDWRQTLGWQATGQRSDRLDGHRAVTVYYSRGGRTVAYTIVSAPALAQPHAAPVHLRSLELRAVRVDGRTVVTWRRAGRTCVLSSIWVSAQTLERMAAWGS